MIHQLLNMLTITPDSTASKKYLIQVGLRQRLQVAPYTRAVLYSHQETKLTSPLGGRMRASESPLDLLLLSICYIFINFTELLNILIERNLKEQCSSNQTSFCRWGNLHLRIVVLNVTECLIWSKQYNLLLTTSLLGKHYLHLTEKEDESFSHISRVTQLIISKTEYEP